MKNIELHVGEVLHRLEHAGLDVWDLHSFQAPVELRGISLVIIGLSQDKLQCVLGRTGTEAGSLFNLCSFYKLKALGLERYEISFHYTHSGTTHPGL